MDEIAIHTVKKIRIRQSTGDRVFGFINSAFLVLLSLATLIPFLSVFLSTITPMSQLQSNPNAFIVIPHNVTLMSYIWLFKGSNKLISAYLITILRTVAGTAACLFVTVLTAYPLSKKYLPGRNVFMALFFFTMLFSGGMIPTYLVVMKMGLTNTFFAMIIPCVLNVYYMIIMRTFFQSLPEEIYESARMDGATDMKILFAIVLPMALPTLASIGLFYAVFHWNSFFDVVLYVQNRALWPLQMLMRDIVATNSSQDLSLGGLVGDPNKPNDQVIVNCTVMISAIPIMLLYPFLQRYFVKGLTIGSLKG